MKIEIKKLSSELIDDYLHFFDTTPHDDELDEHKCYCVCWSSANSEGQDFSTAEHRRELAIKYIQSNVLQGYLAYCEGKPIGWCNCNTKSDCLECVAGRMYLAPLVETDTPDTAVVKSVFCFVVAPEMRRMGIAKQLLERVCMDAKAEGYDFVEAYPIKEFVSTQYDYMGPYNLYIIEGFSVFRDLGDRAIMRKKLN